MTTTTDHIERITQVAHERWAAIMPRTINVYADEFEGETIGYIVVSYDENGAPLLIGNVRRSELDRPDLKITGVVPTAHPRVLHYGAPRRISTREALELAQRDRIVERSNIGDGWWVKVGVLGGGLAPVDHARTRSMALTLLHERRYSLFARILGGECLHTISYHPDRDRFTLE